MIKTLKKILNIRKKKLEVKTEEEKQEGELMPLIKIQRPPCPFRGFNSVPPVLLDSAGNQCGLLAGAFSPCQMEIEGKIPCWEDCHFNSEDNKAFIGLIIRTWRIFPQEFRSTDGGPDKGIPFKQWWDYIFSNFTKEQCIEVVARQ